MRKNAETRDTPNLRLLIFFKRRTAKVAFFAIEFGIITHRWEERERDREGRDKKERDWEERAR